MLTFVVVVCCSTCRLLSGVCVSRLCGLGFVSLSLSVGQPASQSAGEWPMRAGLWPVWQPRPSLPASLPLPTHPHPHSPPACTARTFTHFLSLCNTEGYLKEVITGNRENTTYNTCKKCAVGLRPQPSAYICRISPCKKETHRLSIQSHAHARLTLGSWLPQSCRGMMKIIMYGDRDQSNQLDPWHSLYYPQNNFPFPLPYYISPGLPDRLLPPG